MHSDREDRGSSGSRVGSKRRAPRRELQRFENNRFLASARYRNGRVETSATATDGIRLEVASEQRKKKARGFSRLASPEATSESDWLGACRSGLILGNEPHEAVRVLAVARCRLLDEQRRAATSSDEPSHAYADASQLVAYIVSYAYPSARPWRAATLGL